MCLSVCVCLCVCMDIVHLYMWEHVKHLNNSEMHVSSPCCSDKDSDLLCMQRQHDDFTCCQIPRIVLRDVHRGVAQVAWATAHMPSSTQVALPRKKKINIYIFFNH